MKLEGIDPQHPSMYFVLTVAEVSQISININALQGRLCIQDHRDRWLRVSYCFIMLCLRFAVTDSGSILTDIPTAMTSGWMLTRLTSILRAGVRQRDTNCTLLKVRGPITIYPGKLSRPQCIFNRVRAQALRTQSIAEIFVGPIVPHQRLLMWDRSLRVVNKAIITSYVTALRHCGLWHTYLGLALCAAHPQSSSEVWVHGSAVRVPPGLQI